MFIINITYKTALENVDRFLAEHITFLEEQYAKGHFIASGRKVPRTGGIILAKTETKEALNAILEKDPFKINDLAVYEVIEFMPSKTAPELDFLNEA